MTFNCEICKKNNQVCTCIGDYLERMQIWHKYHEDRKNMFGPSIFWHPGKKCWDTQENVEEYLQRQPEY